MKKTEEVMEYSHIEWTDFCVEQEKKMVKIAFLQIMPGETLEGNKQRGICACREAKEKGAYM